MLVSTSASPHFQIGRNIFSAIHRRDLRMLKKSDLTADLLLRVKQAGKYRAIFCTHGVFGIPELLLLFPLDAPPAAFSALANAGVLPDVLLSPDLAAVRPTADGNLLESAYLELSLCRSFTPDFTEPTTAEHRLVRCETVLRRLTSLPPLTGCRISLDLSAEAISHPLPADLNLWSGLLFSLCLFLYRITADAAISISLLATKPDPTVLLTAKTAIPIPPGACPLEWLTERYPDLPELALCLALAHRGGAALEAFGTPDGALGIAGQPRKIDPALYGLKQDPRLSDAAAEAAAREWCRLLPDAAPTEK